MKILINLLLFSFVAIGFVGCSTSAPLTPESLIGNPAPMIRVTLLDGEQLPLTAFQSKKTILFFWDTHCAQSRKIMQGILELLPQLSKRTDLRLLTVSIDKSEALPDVKARVAKIASRNVLHTFSGNDLMDEAYVTFNGTEIPLFVFIDAQGIVRAIGHSQDDFEEMLGK